MKKKLAFICMITAIFLFATGFRSDEQKVYDNAGLLTEQEAARLQGQCVETAQIKGIDIIIVTENGLRGKSPMDYADDFYDEHAFGYEQEHGTGILLLVDMGNRDWWISTSGEAIRYFPVKRTDKMGENIAAHLSKAEYMEAFETFIAETGNYMGKDPKQDGLAVKLLIFLGIGLVSGTIVTGILYHRQKTPMTVNSRTYMKGRQPNVLQQYDRYIRTTTVSRHIERSSGSSGGSGVHTSSGGHSHGGSGGKF